MDKKNDIDLMVEILERAEELDLMMFDRVSLMMDLHVAHEEFNLRLSELASTDNFNFSHDIVGIQQNVNRETASMEGLFVPRFASND